MEAFSSVVDRFSSTYVSLKEGDRYPRLGHPSISVIQKSNSQTSCKSKVINYTTLLFRRMKTKTLFQTSIRYYINIKYFLLFMYGCLYVYSTIR